MSDALPPRPAAATVAEPLWFRLLRAFALVGVPFSVLLHVLAAPGAPPSEETPFLSRREERPAIAIPLRRAQSARGVAIHRLSLSAPRLRALLEHEELHLTFLVAGGGGPSGPRGRRWPQRRLQSASLEVAGSPCRYEARARANLAASGRIAFLRTPGCPGAAGAGAGELLLTLVSVGREALALQAFDLLPGEEGRSFLYVAPGSGSPARLVNGSYVDWPPRVEMSRVALLNGMWQVSERLDWIWAALGVGFALAVLGLALFPLVRVPRDEPASLRFVLSAGAGAFGLAASLAWLYAVLSPPLMAPDEPSHLLGYAALAGDPGLASQTKQWIQGTHVQRIRFTTNRFGVKDIGRPYTRQQDPYAGAHDAWWRSAAVARLWKLASRGLQGLPAPRALLAMRLLNALLFAGTVGAATAFAAACAPGPLPQLLPFPLLLVPALPFFAMHLSETSVLCCAYVLVSTSLGVLFLDGPRSAWAGLPLGLGTGIMLGGGRSGWPLVALLGLVLSARLGLGSRSSARPLRSAVVYWLGFGAGATAFYVFPDESFFQMLGMYGRNAPDGLRTVVFALAAQPLVPFGVAVLGTLAETRLQGLRHRLGSSLDSPLGGSLPLAARALGAAVVLSLFASLFVSFPLLEPVTIPNSTPLARYAGQALLAAATSFRLTEPDYHFFSSFFGGFGWQDTLPPAWFLTGLVLLGALGLVALLSELARTRDLRRAAWLAVMAAGWAASLVVYALAIHGLPMNINGRYLIGWYLSVLLVIGSWPALSEASTRISRPPVLLGLAGLSHTYCLCLILGRYF